MTALTAIVSREMRTSSMQVAKNFNKAHATVIRAINTLRIDLPRDDSNFAVIEYTDVMNRKQQGVEMTRDGFSILAMGFTGSEALQWKLKFLAAFNAMEAELLKQQAKENSKLEWNTARLQIKSVRKSFTNTVQEFVEYATAQGSKSASMYYMNLTKMEYKALDLLDKQKSALGNFRDTLDILDIAALTMAEVIAKSAIEHGMREGMHYKEIFQFAKQRVNEYAAVVALPRLEKAC
jgi:Rha family phage regulatory protein